MTSIVLTRKLSVRNIFVFMKLDEESNLVWNRKNLVKLLKKIWWFKRKIVHHIFSKPSQLKIQVKTKLDWSQGKEFDTEKFRQITLMKWQNGGNLSKPNFGAHGGRHLYYHRWCRFQSWTRQFSRAFTRIQFFYET